MRSAATAIVVCACLAGCRSPRATRVDHRTVPRGEGPASHPAAVDRDVASIAARDAEIRDRTLREFADAIFYKPRVAEGDEAQAYLAPLIVQEVAPDGDGGDGAPMFGELRDDDGAGIRVDISRAVIYGLKSTISLGQAVHEQTSYVWFYPPDARSSGDSPIRVRGVRITFDRDGLPAIWELLRVGGNTFDGGMDDAAVIFVSASLERAAAASYGPPLPGRRYSVESSLERNPDAVVARVLDDGPAAMGPIVYLDASDLIVTTVICRCMPAQFQNAVRAIYYDVIWSDCSGAISPSADSIRRALTSRPSALADVLRLPPEF